jgi:predicted phosphodiesterase
MYFIGDTHGVRPVFVIIDKHNLQGQNLIHVGDFGLGFQEISRDLHDLSVLDEALLETDNKLFVVRGNHDNPIFWKKSAGLNLPKYHNIKLVDDYTVLKIEGKNILCVGGGISIDRQLRKDDSPYPTWWADEEFVYNNTEIARVEKFYSKIDIVVTHSAPGFCHPTSDDVPIVNEWARIEQHHGRNLKTELKIERTNITSLHDRLVDSGLKPEKWIYGHFHSTKKQVIAGTEFKLLNINELYEVN